MNKEERDELIAVLLMWSNWNKAALESLSNRKLLEEYDRYNRMTKG